MKKDDLFFGFPDLQFL